MGRRKGARAQQRVPVEESVGDEPEPMVHAIAYCRHTHGAWEVRHLELPLSVVEHHTVQAAAPDLSWVASANGEELAARIMDGQLGDVVG